MVKNKFTYILGLLLVISCGRKSPESYLMYVNNPDNGLVSSLQLGDFTVTCEYKPAAFLVLNEKYKSCEVINKAEFEILEKEAAEINTFYIRFKGRDQGDFLKQGLRNQNEYYTRLDYYSNSISNDLVLISGSDTLPCTYTYFERNYGAGMQSTLIAGFATKNTKHSGDMKLMLKEQALGLGNIEFTVKNSDLNKLPQISL